MAAASLDPPRFIPIFLTGSATALILHRGGCDERSISDLMTLASWGERGHQEALYCVHQLLKCPPWTAGGGKGQIQKPAAFLANNVKNCWRAMGDAYVDEDA